MKRKINLTALRVMTLMLITVLPARVLSQEIVFVVHADPVICMDWFK